MNSKIILKVGLSIEPQVLTVGIECLVRSELVYSLNGQSIDYFISSCKSLYGCFDI